MHSFTVARGAWFEAWPSKMTISTRGICVAGNMDVSQIFRIAHFTTSDYDSPWQLCKCCNQKNLERIVVNRTTASPFTNSSRCALCVHECIRPDPEQMIGSPFCGKPRVFDGPWNDDRNSDCSDTFKTLHQFDVSDEKLHCRHNLL